MENQVANDELTDERIRDELHLKIIISIFFAAGILFTLALIANFVWPLIKNLF